MNKSILVMIFSLSLLGCESDYEKCFAVEKVKMEESLKMSNPFIAVYAELDPQRDRLTDYWRVKKEFSAKVRRVTKDCDYDPDSACTKEWESLRKAEDENIKKLGLSDIDRLVDRMGNVAHSDPEKYKQLLESFEVSMKNFPSPDENDLDGQVAMMMAVYDFQRDFFLNQIDVAKLTANAPAMAAEVCNSRGLYK